jgi:hypothetical protein
MVIPPVVVSADVVDRAEPAAVLIETTMETRRDKGVILREVEPHDVGADPGRQPGCATFLRVLAIRRV